MIRILPLLLLFGCSRTSTPELASVTVTVQWLFENRDRGAIISSPIVDSDFVYLYGIRDLGAATRGFVKKLALESGKEIWHFDEDGDLRHGYSTPAINGDSLYVGEGMHANHFCHLFCIDTATGKKRWSFRAEGHIESSPVVVANRVFFGAGDDGLFCLDAVSGKEIWHFRDSIHVDSRPEVWEDRVYIGGGISRAFRESGLRCLDAKTGNVLWQLPTPLPAWGSPMVHQGLVHFGLGNGRLDSSAPNSEHPRGAWLALDAISGKRLWQFDLPDAAMNRGVAKGERVCFTCRDGNLYCLETQEGRLKWKQPLGSPGVTVPLIEGDQVIAIGTEGRVACFSLDGGKPLWQFDVAKHSGTKPRLFSSPVSASGNRILFGSELKSGASSRAVLYCLQVSPATPEPRR